MQQILQNFVFFQIGWFACVMGAAYDMPWVGLLLTSIIIGLHVFQAESPKPEILLLVIVALLGTAWDSILTFTGQMQFSNGVIINGMAPYWLIAMWPLFATTLNVSLRWLKGRLVLGFVFGLAGGPLAYYAGHKLGAVEFPSMLHSLIFIGLGWSVIMPLILTLSEQFDGYKRSEAQTA